MPYKLKARGSIGIEYLNFLIKAMLLVSIILVSYIMRM